MPTMPGAIPSHVSVDVHVPSRTACGAGDVIWGPVVDDGGQACVWTELSHVGGLAKGDYDAGSLSKRPAEQGNRCVARRRQRLGRSEAFAASASFAGIKPRVEPRRF